MLHPVTRSWWFAVAACLIACLAGCGEGVTGFDDVLPGSCAVGSAPPFQPQVLPSEESASRMKIYLLSGFLNFYSLGFNQLAGEMRGFNFSPMVVDWPRWENAAHQIISSYTGPADGNLYVLVGHSYGADDAIRIARHMKDSGIEVRLLFLLDATSPPPIPDNVDRCIHYYEPWLPGDLFPDFFSGNPVVADPGNTRTEIQNLLFNREALGDEVGCADHFSMDVNELMHNLIMTEVFRLMAADAADAGSKAASATRDALPQ
jgi:pimeloyl-ACP methyl ester carboxylesterase